MNDEKLREAMIGELQTKPCRSRELFQKVAVDERAGREVLSTLIDDGRVFVETDWTLRVKEPGMTKERRLELRKHVREALSHLATRGVRVAMTPNDDDIDILIDAVTS